MMGTFWRAVCMNTGQIQMKTSKKNLRGFTLVELLVVIGIISILVAVSFPYLMSAMNRARTAQCAGNLHFIGIGLIAFAGDNEGNFPIAGGLLRHDDTDPDPNTGQYAWTRQIEPYMGGRGTDIYRCPDSSKILPENATYSYFLGAHAAYSQTHGFGAVNLLRLHSASQHILAGDIAYKSFSVDDADKDDYTQDPAFNGNSGKIPIHQGTVNILFADGHVENLRSFDKNTMTTRYDGPGFDYLQ